MSQSPLYVSARWSLSTPWRQPDDYQMWSTTPLTQHTLSQLLSPPGPSLQHLEAGLRATDLSTRVILALHILRITALHGLKVQLAGLHSPLRGVELLQPSVPEDHREVSPGADISHPGEDVNLGPCPVLGGQTPTPAPPSSLRPQCRSPQWRLSPILTPS